MPEGAVVGVLLAGGGARRFGTQKLVHPIGGVPLVRRAAEGLLASTLDAVVVVLGSDAARVGEALAGLPLRTVVASDWSDGMSATLRRGVEALGEDAGAALVALGDQPAVAAGIVDPLVAHWRAGGALVVAPSFRGAVRPPVLFDRALFGELGALRGDRGARAVLEADPSRVATVSFDRDPPADVDEPGDVAPLDSAG
ncbi:MAG TPA: nucleotidyltransferase family protein [Gemmatimonadaceae bacterium]|nr:nucleotidyltransferase family protein [Gemmatimonadaceae bacterium]